MSSNSSSRPVPLFFLIGGLLFQGISGLGGGGALVWNPTGTLLQRPLDLLERSPFADYLVPGLILFTVLGIGPLIVAVGLWKRHSWAWYGAGAIAGGLIIWIAVEIWMIGYHPQPPLQLTYGLLGVVLLILTLPRRAGPRTPPSTGRGPR